MIAFLKEWVLNIITLAMFIVLLEILIPSGKTKKYINLVSGLILIIAMVTPVLKFIGKEVDLIDLQIPASNFLDKKEIEASSRIMEEDQLKLMTDVYRKKVIRQLEESIMEIEGISRVKADVIINEDLKSQSFGEIKRVYLYLDMIDDNKIKPVVKVEKIKISDESKKENNKEEVDPNIRNNIEEKVNKIFQVDRKNIVLSLQ